MWTLEDFKNSLSEKCIKADDVEELIEEGLIRRPSSYLTHPNLKARVERNPGFAWKLIQKLATDAGHRDP